MVDREIINKVELAIIRHLQDRLGATFNIAQVDIEVDFDQIIKFPAVAVSTDSIGLRKSDMNNDLAMPVTHLHLLFRSVKATKRELFKRHGIYPIVIGVMQVLKDVDFGFDIGSLTPRGAKEVVSELTVSRDIIAWDLPFAWDFELTDDKNDAIDADLIEIVNKYMLENTSEIVSDTVTLNEV